MNSLELATQQELVDELQRRNSSSVILLLKEQKNNTEHDLRSASWDGGACACIGLAEVFAFKMKHHMANAQEVIEGDEEDDE